jgi:hypothetical protein
MRTPDTAYVSAALAAAEVPCVSIYLPTHRSYPDNQQDAIRYRNLVGQVEETLARSYPRRTARDVTDRLRALENDQALWAGATDTMVVLASPARCDAFTLPRAFPERVEVGATFHVKPLLRHVQSADRFHVLGLARERVALFHGNRYELAPLEVPGLPLTMPETLGTETFEPVHQLRAAAAAPNAGAQHAEGSRKQDVVPDVERFFRTVDRAVTRLVSEPSGLPLIPVGIEENLAEFRAVTKNRFATAEAVPGDWTNWNLNEIRERAWKVFEKGYLGLLASIREDYGTAAARGRATQHVAEAARAAAVGRVGILLVDADRSLPGSIDPATGDLHKPATADGHAGDMLDDLAEIALKTGARVIVTPSANMPTDTGLAAIFRY